MRQSKTASLTMMITETREQGKMRTLLFDVHGGKVGREVLVLIV